MKKRKKNDRCRCGTGATKGTLGDPCTGQRCPCYSSGKGCDNCGCKNCANPLKITSDVVSVPTLVVSQTIMTDDESPPLQQVVIGGLNPPPRSRSASF